MNNDARVSIRSAWRGALLAAALLALHAHAALLTGSIAAISPPQVTVGSTLVTTTPQTVISQACTTLALADLAVGDAVTVEGTLQADGTIVASAISRGAACIASGPIEALGADSIVVAGRSFQVDAATVIQAGCTPGAFSALQVGETVSVDAQVVNGAAPLALSITAAGACTISGAIEAIAGSQLVVAGRTVTVDGQTAITRGCDAIAATDLSVGDRATVVADALSDGTLLADSIAVGACSALDAFVAKVEREGAQGFALEGTFRLGADSNGIDPAREPLSASIAGAALTLPAGSLRPHGAAEWRFEGRIGAARVEARLQLQRGTYAIQLQAKGGVAVPPGPTVPVALTIGDDRGRVVARVEG